MTISPLYRVVLNKNLLVDPGFIEYLKMQFRNVLYSMVGQKHVDLEQTYKFTIYEIPLQWDSFVLSTILMAQSDLTKLTPKQEKISQILLDLNPLDPKPVDLEFRLADIVSFVARKVTHFTELVPITGIVHYFGINQMAWFDDYPIQTGTVMRAVDYGTLDNFPLHLFDSVFTDISYHLLDYFVMYNKGELPDVHLNTDAVEVKSPEPEEPSGNGVTGDNTDADI